MYALVTIRLYLWISINTLIFIGISSLLIDCCTGCMVTIISCTIHQYVLMGKHLNVAGVLQEDLSLVEAVCQNHGKGTVNCKGI